jgi:hypothetical protein
MRFCIIPPRTCQSTLVISASLHDIEMIFAGSVRRKSDKPTVGRPSRIFAIERFRSQLARLTAVNRDRKNSETISDSPGVDDAISFGRPFGRSVVTATVSKSSRIAAG